MQSFYLVAFFLGIIVVVYWTRRNDAVPPGGRTKGLLRMTFKESATGDLPEQTGKTVASTQDGPQPGNLFRALRDRL